jgi:hypothetical protein
MIAVAAVAVMMGVHRLLALCASVTRVALGFHKSGLCLVIDDASHESDASGSG